MDEGASLRDRAVAAAPSSQQAVSPVPASIPSANEMRRVTQFLAQIASDVAYQAGVGGMETAGGFVSYLAANPERVEAFMAGGVFDIPPQFHVEGCLSWHGMDGKIHRPRDIRARQGRADQ